MGQVGPRFGRNLRDSYKQVFLWDRGRGCNRVLFTWARRCQQKGLLCHGLLRVAHEGWWGSCKISTASKLESPLSELSIPRLELMSARILAQLMHIVKNALQSQVKLDGVRFGLNIKTALSWIQNKANGSSSGTIQWTRLQSWLTKKIGRTAQQKKTQLTTQLTLVPGEC